MSKCIICKKELPESIKAPICEYHRAQAKEKWVIVASGVASTAFTAVKLAPKVIPVVKEKAPEIAKAAGNAAKVIIRK